MGLISLASCYYVSVYMLLSVEISMLQKIKHILVEVLHFNEVDVEVVHFWCTSQYMIWLEQTVIILS